MTMPQRTSSPRPRSSGCARPPSGRPPDGRHDGPPRARRAPGRHARRPPERPGAPPAVTFLTVAEVAAMMRVSKMTVYRLVHAGELSAVRVGRSFRVPERAVQDYLRDAYTDIA